MGILVRAWNMVFLSHEDVSLMVVLGDLLAYPAVKLASDHACLTVMNLHLCTWVWASRVEHLARLTAW